jgi:hypothetical protein
MKKFKKILTFLFIIILGVLFLKDIFLKVVFENGVRFATGVKLSVDSFNVGVFKSRVNITGLKLYNPKGFEDRIMLDIPNIFIDYSLPAIFERRAYFKELKLNLKELKVVKNKEGKTNLDYLNSYKEQKEGVGKKDKLKAKTLDIQIDNLELRIGRLIYKDYTKKGAPLVKEFNVNLYEKYADITNINTVLGTILVKVFARTTIFGIASGASLTTDIMVKPPLRD